MIRLFIENNEIELDETVQVAITKQFEDLSNPTDIINEWSKTVSIPFTVRNNRIFGHIYNPDKMIVDGGTVGVYFNPLLKLNFRLEWNSGIVMMGYAKLNEVKQVAGKGTYELTLFGQLGKVFQEIKKITFDTSTDETEYLIDGSEYVDDYITKDLVYSSWVSQGQTKDVLQKKSDVGYNITDIIGFAPNNSFSEDFDYTTAQSKPNLSLKFTDVLGTGFTQATGVEPSTAIPNGMLPREIGEYRSYLQLPYIYFNKLFQVFQSKAETLTGYQFDLDDSWFNSSNPYWYNLVYMLKHFDSKSEETVNNYYKIAPDISPGWGGVISAYTQVKNTYFVFNEKTEVKPIVDSNDYIQLSDDYTVFFNTTYTIELDISNYNNLRINPANGLQYSFTVLDENSNILKEVKYLMVDNAYNGNTDNYDEVLRFGRQGSGAFRAYPELKLLLNKGEFGDKVRIGLKAVWLNQNAPFLDEDDDPFMPSPTQYFGYINLYVYNVPTNNPITCNIIYNRKRSFNHFSLNDLWNKDYNIFDEILKYCKMYRIGISVDDYDKKIIFKPFVRYFTDYTVKNWTEKVDKSKDFIITPITFTNKYVLFNYDESKTKVGEEYKEKYGVNYGEYRITTDYNFNNETTNLFKDIQPSITNTDNVLSWTNLYDNRKIMYSFPAEIYVCNKDKDKKQVDLFGSYFFHNGTTDFSTEEYLRLRNVYLSDDTQFQISNNSYFYTQITSMMKRVYSYPKLDIVRGDNLCVFNIPKENYTYLNNYSEKNSIYSNLWENYLNERYNVQNKMITCYVNIKPQEYNQFQWNKLVKLGNQLCIVNKIYDYDVTNNEPTKVDLITIQNIEGYTSNNYSYDYIITSEHNITIPYDYYKVVTVKANGNWIIHADDWSDNLAAYPESGTSGETNVIIGTTDENVGGTITFDLMDENNINVLASDYVTVSVGGTPTVSASPWYNQVAKGNSITVNMSTSTSWKVFAYDKGGNDNRVITVRPTQGVGNTALTITASANSATGVVDVYLKDINSNNVTSFRVNITE